MEETQTQTQGRQKERVGRVVSDKMAQTVVVQVERRVRHPLYNKVVRLRKKYYAQNDEDKAKLGDTVRIVESRPLSKTKRWRVAAILERAK